jgi:hypothetical protein
MVQTLGLGRLPRVAGSGLKVQIGTCNVGGTPGSFAVAVNTIRHLNVRVLTTIGTVRWVLPLAGSSKKGYAYVNTVNVGTSGYPWPIGTASANVPISFEVIGE